MSRFLLLLPVTLLVVGADAKEDLAKKELKKFEGTWVMGSGERDGAKIADEHVQKSKITWKGKAEVVETPHQSKEAIKVTIGGLDPTKKPAEMDWVRSNGPDSGQKMLAIYEFIDDDQYRICFAPAGKERPKEFSTKAGSGHLLHVWKRVKK
jgi:uncharacterized protein (TIGR03067 family)